MFYVFDKCSDSWSKPYATREEAVKDMMEDVSRQWSFEAEIIETEEGSEEE